MQNNHYFTALPVCLTQSYLTNLFELQQPVDDLIERTDCIKPDKIVSLLSSKNSFFLVFLINVPRVRHHDAYLQEIRNEEHSKRYDFAFIN